LPFRRDGRILAALNIASAMPKDRPGKYPTVGPQANIDNAATALVKKWFASGWVVQEQVPNYHEDYVVEWVDGGELTGTKFSAQQKGHATVLFSKRYCAEQIKTKHLLYYGDKVRVPMFLFVVDTTKERGYYLFLQEWLDHNSSPTELKTKTKLTVKVPLENNLADRVKFVTELKRATAYLLAKYPGDPIDALKADAKKVEAIDPRWRVKLDVINSNKHYTLSAKEDIAATLTLAGEHAAKFKDTFDYGKPVHLQGAGIALHGSPLFEDLQKKGAIASVSFSAKQHKIELHLWSEGVNAFRLTLPGAITVGKVGLSFIASLPDAPLDAEMKISKEEVQAKTGVGNFSLTFDFKKWEKKSIQGLPYFDKLRGFANAIVDKKLIHQEFTSDGNRVTGGTLGDPNGDLPFAYAAAVIQNIEKARAIAAKLGLEIHVPNIETMAPEAFEDVDFAYDIIMTGRHVANDVELTKIAKMSSDTNDAKDAVEKIEGMQHDGMTFGRVEQKNIYGVPVVLGQLMYSIKPVKVTIPEPGRADFLEGRAPFVTVHIASTDDSVLTVMKA
jgi:hypothetical protein